MKAPELDGLVFVKGQPFTLEDAKNQHVLVVECWATWCPPCVKSIPHVSLLQRKYNDAGLVVVGVSSEDQETVKVFAEKMGSKMDYRVASGQAGSEYMRALNVRGIPCAFVVDPSGNIVWNGHPMKPEFEQVISQALEGLSRVQKKGALKGKTRQEVEHLSVNELKTVLAFNDVDHKGAMEKSELIDLVFEHCT